MFWGTTPSTDQDEDDDEDDSAQPGAWQNWGESASTELLGELPPRQRSHPEKDKLALEVWHLCHQLGSHKKVAAKLNLPVTTVQSKYQRGFEIITGKPFTAQNLERYLRAQEREKLQSGLSHCQGCDKRNTCKEPCEKLLNLCPEEFTESMARPMAPEEVSELYGKYDWVDPDRKHNKPHPRQFEEYEED